MTMSKSTISLSAALLFALAACEQGAAPSAPPRASVDAPDLFFHARQEADAARARVWRLGREGVFVLDLAAPAKVVPLEGWQWAAPPYGCLPGLALGPKGEAVVTSNVLPVLWRVDPRTLAVSVHTLVLDADADKDVGFAAIAWSAENGAYFGVSQADGALWRIDAQLSRGHKVAQLAPLREEPCPEAALQMKRLSLEQ